MASNKALIEPEKSCKLCANPRLSKKWTNLIITGEKTSVEAASVLKMSIDAVEAHVYKHEKGTVIVETPKRDKETFLVQLDDINAQLQDALEAIANDTELDTRKLTSVTKEIRETLKLLAEVSGIIGADNSALMQQQLNNMQQKYLTLTGLILEECCPVCQKKIVDRLKGESVVEATPKTVE
jgi:RNA polymerase subunit RPABC4/transcription elongation factor Spt4